MPVGRMVVALRTPATLGGGARSRIGAREPLGLGSSTVPIAWGAEDRVLPRRWTERDQVGEQHRGTISGSHPLPPWSIRRTRSAATGFERQRAVVTLGPRISGRVNRKQAPVPGSPQASSRPWCRRASSMLIARPSPVPPERRTRDGSERQNPAEHHFSSPGPQADTEVAHGDRDGVLVGAIRTCTGWCSAWSMALAIRLRRMRSTRCGSTSAMTGSSGNPRHATRCRHQRPGARRCQRLVTVNRRSTASIESFSHAGVAGGRSPAGR